MVTTETGEQLTLDLAPRLLYSVENFLIHQGVRELVQGIDQAILDRKGRIIVVAGDRRSGKSHAAVFLTDRASSKGRYPVLVEGSDLAPFLEARQELTNDDVIIVDDAQAYFSKVLPGSSGAFVRFCEAARRGGALIVFITGANLEELPCDEHIVSRLRGALHFQIGTPDIAELPEMLDLMARQRGFRLPNRQRRYLEKRLRRDIPSLEQYLNRLERLSNLFQRRLSHGIVADAIAKEAQRRG